MQRSFSMQQSWVFTVYTGMDSHSFLPLKNKEYEKVGKTQGIKIKDKKKGKEKKLCVTEREQQSLQLSPSVDTSRISTRIAVPALLAQP